MNWSNVISYLNKGDSPQVKFLASVEHEDILGKIVTAMANSQGGIIFIGLDISNNHLVGLNMDVGYLEQLCKKWCRPQPSLQISSIVRGNKQILYIQVPEGNSKPYFYKRICYAVDQNVTGFVIIEKEVAEQPNFEPVVSNYISQAPRFAVLDTIAPKPQVVLEEPVSVFEPTSISLSPVVISVSEAQVNVVQNQIDVAEIKDLNPRQLKGLEFLRTNKSIKNQQYRTICGVSHKTAHIELTDMINKGYLTAHGAGRSACYLYNPQTAAKKQELFNS